MARNKSGRPILTARVPFTGKASIIKDGTLVMIGVTQGTDMGLAIPVPVSNAGTDQFAILKGDSVVANDSVQAGTTWTYAEVELIGSPNLVELDYSLATADLVTVTSFSGTTVTITSLENNADCGWLYVAAGTGIGQLMFCTAINGGTATIKTAPAVALDSTSKLVHIKRFGMKVWSMNVNSLLKSTAAAGTFTFFGLENYIESSSNGISKQLLDPTKHDNITLKGVGTAAPKVTFSTVGIPRLIAGYA